MSSRRWKRNKLLTTFLKSKGKRAAASRKTAGSRAATVSFSLLPPVAHTPTEHVSSNVIEMDSDSEFYQNEADYQDMEETASGAEDAASATAHTRPRSHRVSHSRQLDAWNNAQQSMVDMFTSKLAMPSGQLCMMCPNRASHRCCDCSSLAFYCEDCCRNTHRYNNFLHMPEVWSMGQYVLSPLEDIVLPLTHDCSTAYSERITIISIRGQHHSIVITLCGCTSMSERLIQLGLWPATPTKPTLAFTLSLMDIIHSLVLECQSSLHDIHNFLKLTGKKQPKDRDFYKHLTTSFPQYRYFKQLIKTSIFLEKAECPACPKAEALDPLTMSIDGCFRLCRRKNAGKTSSDIQPLLQPSFFLSQSDVDKYVNSEDRSSSHTVEGNCSDFKAGDVLRSHSRFHMLDETAVFGAICHHDFPLLMLSPKHGERLSYADFLLTSMIEMSVLPKNVRLLYDVGCKLNAHWKANSEKYKALLMCFNSIAVPIFHAYAHIASCQHMYSPRNSFGFGLTDGENVERLWSFLGRFSRMTKEMSAGNRVDALSDALTYYCTLKETSIVRTCIERFSKACTQYASATNEVETIIKCADLNLDDLPHLQSVLMADEEKRLGRKPIQQHSNSWRVQYVKLLVKLKDTRARWSKLIHDMTTSGVSPQVIIETIQYLSSQEHQVQQFEVEHNIQSRWEPEMEEYREALKILMMTKQQELKQQMLELAKERLFYLAIIANHAGGQKQASRVSKLIRGCTRKIKKCLIQYQKLQEENGEIVNATVKDVCNLQSSFWVTEHAYSVTESENRIPVSNQRRLVELLNLKDRACEEKQLAIADLIRTHLYYCEQVQVLTAHLFECINSERVTAVQSIEHPQDINELYTYLQTELETVADHLPPMTSGRAAALLQCYHTVSQKVSTSEESVRLIVEAYWKGDTNNFIIKAKNVHKNSLPKMHQVQPLSLSLQSESSTLGLFCSETTSSATSSCGDSTSVHSDDSSMYDFSASECDSVL